MGLLSRFRHASSSTPAPTSSTSGASSSSSHLEATPTPTLRPPTPKALEDLSPPQPDFAKQRPALAPPSPSSSSITSRISRKPWKRAQSHTHEVKEKQKAKGKERVGAGDETVGTRYEETSPPLPPPTSFLAHGSSRSAPNTPQARRKSTFLSSSSNDPQPPSPLVASTSLGSMLLVSSDHNDERESLHSPDNHDLESGKEDRKALRQARVSSDQFKQEGGILGKLNFESTDGLATSPPEKWLRRASDPNDPSQPQLLPQRKLTKSRTNKTPSPEKQNLPPANVSPNQDDPLVDGMANLSVDQVRPPQPSQDQGRAGHFTPPKADDTGSGETGQRHGPVAEEEKMELLESAEKKTKFWKRPRRHSRSVSTSDPVDIDRSGSPTPRKLSVPSNPVPDSTSTRTSSDLQQPRPQQLRRPSSSLFHNPFTRSVSRTSLALDLDKPTVDDGSFQLRGFRHVSGMMEVEGPGELENYLSHFRKDPTNNRSSAYNSTDQIVSPTLAPGSPSGLGLGEPTSPPSSFTPVPRPRQSSKPLSRPPSIANSLASATGDEFSIPSARVSVAAFRKGIRRPSEGLTTMSDIGHGFGPGPSQGSGLSNGLQSPLHDDDDDDDLPLGMLNRRKELGREKSSQSLSSLRNMEDKVVNKQPFVQSPERKPSPSPAASSRDRSFSPTPSPGPTPNLTSASLSVTDTDPIVRKASPALSVGGGASIPRKSSPNPALSFTVQRQKHQRNGGGSGGFVVKSTRLSRDDLLSRAATGTGLATSPVPSPSPGQNDLHPPAFATPPALTPATPIPPTAQEQEQGIPLASSPEQMSPVDGYFSTIAPYISTFQQEKEHNHEPIPALAPGPPVEPIGIPQPGEKTPASLNLPLPPDQMPDTPPKNPQDLPGGETPLSPGARKRKSLLEEPMRIISGLWNTQPSAEEDGFDPALVLNSMTAYGGDKGSNDPSGGHQDKPLEHQSSHTTLFDLEKVTPGADSSVSAAERARSPLSQRLAGITHNALGNGLTRPSLPHLKTGQEEPNDGYATERYKSPTSDSTLSPSTAIATTTTAATATVPPPATSVSPTRTTFTSSFATAKPRRKLLESSSDESESETTSEHVPQVRIGMMSLRGKAKDTKDSRPRQVSPRRRHPSGPRNPSISNRKRMSSVAGTITPTSPRRPVSSFTTQPLKRGGKDREETGSDSEDEQPLGVLRNRASRSSLSVDRQGKSPSPSTLSVPQHRPPPQAESISSQSLSSVNSRSPPVRGQGLLGLSPGAQERRKTLIELGPVHQPVRDRSTDPGSPPETRNHPTTATSPPGPRTSTSNLPSASRNTNRSAPSVHSRSPARTLIQLPPDEVAPSVGVGRKTASPDSSRSATTGGSGAYQPMTPKEGSEVSKTVVRRRDPSASGRQTLYEEPLGKSNALQVDDRPRAYSTYGQHQPPQHPGQRQQNMSGGQGDMNMMGMGQMGVQGMQGIHPDAMREMMKQQWQMQFMAAAYRASEEEWERQSSVSAQTSHTLPASFGQYPAHMSPNGMPMPMGWNMPPNLNMGMGMGMPYPNHNMPYGYHQNQGPGYGMGMYPPYGHPMPPSSPTSTVAGLGGGGSGGGGMYSYGGGARSVFGGEFGPPAIPPSQRYAATLDVPSNSAQQMHSSHSTVGAGAGGARRGRRGSAAGAGTGSKSVYAASVAGNYGTTTQGMGSSSNPPSSWARRNGSASGSGDWSDLALGQSGGAGVGKPRPQTSFAN
ncbi:hypothetical protein I316_00144 [Kwoniella heveanensis BCC8398]|uniref:Uncharacterized protein n=1 Tax=Kwoniella heveanensis BCC8398 TaxID=1296120 RepID=A0A1B9H3U2_9TREE|nr:hypothetical protein I316_00144 [Kwoniella heveanensis BCC8398]